MSAYLRAMKILMVCHGNFCRSPLAQGILEDKTKKAGLTWEVDSAGTKAYRPGLPPHPLSQEVAKRYGIDITNKKGRNFRKEDIDYFDKIYVMDEENYNEVKRICGKNRSTEKVDFLLNEIYPGENESVPDPWFGDEEDFDAAFKLIEKACERIVVSLLKEDDERANGVAF